MVVYYHGAPMNSVAGLASNVWYEESDLSQTNLQTKLTDMIAVSGSLRQDVDNASQLATQNKSDLAGFEFKNNNGQAQYSMDRGTTWTNFKNPVGTKSITANGTYDVTDYASASVSVPTYGMNTFSALYGGYAGGPVGVTYTTSYDAHAVYIATCLSVGSQGVSTLIYYNGSTRQYNRSKSDKASIDVSRSGNNITFTFGQYPDYYFVGFAKP